MATRVVEGKKPYTGGKAIEIDENKVISLRLRDENNLIIWDEGDNEIYVDLQLDDEITPTSAFPVGITTGRVIVDNGWDEPGTIICAKTTSGDNIKLLYADSGNLYIDNGTGTFKQIYLKADVDALLLALRSYIDDELAKKQNGVVSDTAPENPSEGDLWYNTTNDSMKVWDGNQWSTIGGGGGSDIVYVTQSEYTALLPGALTDNKHYFIYSTSGGGGRQPGADTTMYFKFNGDLKDEISGTTHTASGITYGTLTSGNQYAIFPGASNGCFAISNNLTDSGDEITILVRFQVSNTNNMRNEFSNASGGYYTGMIFQSGNLGAYYYNNSHDICGGSSWSDQLYNANERHLYGQTIKAGGKIKIFLDGVKVGEKNMEATLRGSADGGQYIGVGRSGHTGYFNGKMSEFIVEKVEWAETDISNYFNQTKANYGIS